jgi:hypothetical protein
MSLPGKPVIRNAPRASPNTLEYYWFPPTSTGGNAIEGYQLNLTGDGLPGTITCNVPASELSGLYGYYKITGLSNAVTYTTSIAASTINGYGPTANFRRFQPGSPPTRPPSTTTITLSGVSNAALTWTPPSTLPDATIFWYVIKSRSSNPADPVLKYTANGQTQSNYFIKGMNSNSTYTFTISAVNCPGYSPLISTIPITYGIPITPLYFSGNFLWMDASDPSTVTTSGTTVTQWRDKSPFYYATNTVGGTTSLVTGGLNGLNVLGFSSSYLFAPIAPAWNGERMTALIVGVLSNVNTSPRFLAAGRCNVNDSADSSVAALFFRSTTGTNITTFRNNIRFTTLLSGYNTPFLGSAVLTTGQIQQALNGSNPGTSNGTNSSLFNINMLAFGGDTNTANTANTLSGHIAEIAMFNIDLDPFSRQEMEGYLAWKWGIQTLLPTSHPFYTNKPTSNTTFSPTLYPGMRFWYDAQDSATVIRTLSSVTQWNDKSSNAFHMRQIGTSTIRYNATAVNNYPGLYFSSFAGMSTNAYTLSATSQLTYFMVLNQTQPSPATNSGIFDNAVDYTYLLLFTRGANANVTLVLGDTNERGTGSNIAGLNTLLGFTTNGSNSASLFVNGNTASNFTPGTTSPLNISQPYRLVRSAWTGNICEVMAYSNALSTGDRQTVEGYLAWKWGLQLNLPDTHPYKYMNPSSNYTTSNYVPQNQLVRFTASTYSGSGQWSNDNPLYGSSYNAVIENGTAAKNAEGNGILLPSGTAWRFPPTGGAFGVETRWTMSVWFKRTGDCTANSCIVTNTYGGSMINMYIRAVSATAFQGGYFVSGTFYQGSSYTFPINTWVHMCVTYNGSNITTYINGNFFGSASSTVTPSWNSGTWYRIGRRWDNFEYVNGEIGEVIIYDRALYSSEVLQNYQNTYLTYVTTAPILRYTASTWNATGSWPNTGSLGTGYNAGLNSGSRTKNGAGNGVVLNGSTSYIITTYDFGSVFTVLFWFKRTAANNAGSVILGQPIGGGGDGRTMVQIISGAAGATNTQFLLRSNEKFDSSSSIVPFPTNAWEFMAVSYNKSGTVNMITYVDGSTYGTTTPSGAGSWWNAALYIGSLSAGANTGVVGELGELAVYTRFLTPSEIQQYYQSTRSTYGV